GLPEELLGEPHRVGRAEIRELGVERGAARDDHAQSLRGDGELDAECLEVGKRHGSSPQIAPPVGSTRRPLITTVVPSMLTRPWPGSTSADAALRLMPIAAPSNSIWSPDVLSAMRSASWPSRSSNTSTNRRVSNARTLGASALDTARAGDGTSLAPPG